MRILAIMNCRLSNVMSLTCENIRKVSTLNIVSFLLSSLC